ncbi:MAG: SpoIID/LytB domain-containing protein [Bdellovibrionales bacterium]|nr:SpoIID/LytB domain-containing protein [Bdellovibrionales bacterium]
MGIPLTVRFWSTFSASLLLVNAGSVFAKPLYPLGNSPPHPIEEGTTRQIERDWNRAKSLILGGKPDRTFNSIWVRIFPLVSLPLGDPYPDTQNYRHISLSNAGGIKVFTLAGEVLIGTGKQLEFDFAAGTLKLDKYNVPLEPFWLEPAGTTYTELHWDKGLKLPNGKPAEVRTRMRGGFVVKKSVHQPKDKPFPSEHWSVINVVTINEYIQSVVPSEVIASWHRETLRAQAIAARTYGMYEVATARLAGQDFDVDPSTWFQSYQGISFWNRETQKWRDVELPATTEAVKSTKGEVITHKGEVIKAYFSSNSGGRTCLVTECLEQNFNPDYIQEINDHAQVKSQPGGSWGSRATLTPDNIMTVLRAWGVNPAAPVRRIESLEKGPSGRTWRLRVILQNGSHIDLDRLVTRKIMHLYGPIRSFLYDLGAVGTDGKQAIKGYGYGHAVGMSQWGAQLFAKSGWSAHKILEFYYNQVSIVDLSGN